MNKILEMESSTRRFVEAIRSITGNPTMNRLQCEEWIEAFRDHIDKPRDEFVTWLAKSIKK